MIKIVTMRIALNNTSIDKYFGFLKKLDNSSKKRLITKLNDSIEVNERKKINLDKLHGSWTDSKTSDQIINEIKSARVKKKSIDL